MIDLIYERGKKVLMKMFALSSWALAKKSAGAMVFAAVASATASSLGAATPALSPRSAGKSSWKSRTSSEKGCRTGIDFRVFFFFSSMRRSKDDTVLSHTLCHLLTFGVVNQIPVFLLSATLFASCQLVTLMASNITTRGLLRARPNFNISISQLSTPGANRP
jgi:hypothetical protein